jgi:ABC-2 type transport system ATP-binding protein
MATPAANPKPANSTTGATRAAPRQRRDGTPSVVAVQGLGKTFKDFWLRERARAVDDVSFNVEPGETFGLLGPNGSGKSTTIKIILGLLRPSTGRVAVFGRAPDDVEVKRRIGYLPEESYLYGFLNARETLEYYAKLFQIDRETREKRIDQLLDMVGLGAVQFRPVREYSKGMQRRIGIAQALINDPDLLILDEPTTGLDPIGCRQIKDLILELARRNKTIILSSHVLSDVEDVAHRMVILYGGKIREEGTCDSLLDQADRTIIETDALDGETIAAIDRLIMERTGGRSGVGRVGRPRQRLEDKFIAIVERAVSERVATSGAQHGGTTAGFLKSEPTQDDALIGELVGQGRDEETQRGERVRQADAVKVERQEASGPDRALLGGLLQGQSAAPPPATLPGGGQGTGGTGGASSPSQQKVDQSVIGSLLDPGTAGGKPGGPQSGSQPGAPGAGRGSGT